MLLNEKLVALLKKRAEGYSAVEEVVEYDEGGEVTKRKVTTKNVPPDLAALKLLIELDVRSGDTENMTTEELLELRKNLLEEFYENSIKENERDAMRIGSVQDDCDGGDNSR